jgi:hypothetical protein
VNLANDQPTQRSSENKEGANSLPTPPLVVVRTSGTAAEAYCTFVARSPFSGARYGSLTR